MKDICSTCGAPKPPNRSRDCRTCYKVHLSQTCKDAEPKLTVDDMDETQLLAYQTILGRRKDRQSILDALLMVEVATARTHLAVLATFMPALILHPWLPRIDNYVIAEIDWQVAKRPLAVHRSSLTVAMDQAWG